MPTSEDVRSSSVIKVLCVDDHPDIAVLLEAAINSEQDMESVGVLNRADELVERIGELRPDVVLLDLSMPGKKPLSVIHEIHEQYPQTRTVAFSAYDDRRSIEDAISAGAAGYISKMKDISAIMDGIRRVARGEMVTEAGT